MDLKSLMERITELQQQAVVAESKMSEFDIECQDYEKMSDEEFKTAYGMSKVEWKAKNKDMMSEGEKKKTKTGIIHKGNYGNEYTGDGDDDDEDTKKEKKAKKAEISKKRGRGRPKKDADARTGEVATFDTSALNSLFGGKKPSKEIGKVSAKHKLKEYMESIEDTKHAEAVMEGMFGGVDHSSVAANLGKLAKVIKSVQTPEQFAVAQEYASRMQGTIMNHQHDKMSMGPGIRANMGVMRAVRADLKAKAEELGIPYNDPLAEAEQLTIEPAKQNTQVIKQGGKVLGSVENPQLATTIKQAIGKGEMSLAGDGMMEDDMMEVAPPGMEDTVLALKKKFPGQEGKAYAIAWSDYNKKNGKKTESMMESIDRNPSIEKIIRRFPHEHKQCQEGWGMDEALYEALVDHYFEEGRIPKRLMTTAPIQELKDWVEECYGRDTGMLMDEGIEDRIGAVPAPIDTNPATMNPVTTPAYVRKAMTAGGKPQQLDAPAGTAKDELEEVSDLERHLRASAMHDEEAMMEADEGKHNNATTGFKALAKKAGKEYGSKAAGERVAGAVRAKMAKAGQLEETTQGTEMKKDMKLNELDKKTLGSYVKKAANDKAETSYYKGYWDRAQGGMKPEYKDMEDKVHTGQEKRNQGIKRAMNRLTKESDVQMESWDQQLNQLLTEGQSVSISLGQENMPDSVTVTANDKDAHELIKLLQNAGMGGVVGAAQDMAQATDAEGGDNSMMSVNTDGAEGGDVAVVDFDTAQGDLEGPTADDNGDGALSFLKKMLGQAVDFEPNSGADAEVLHTDGEEESDDEESDDTDKEETDESSEGSKPDFLDVDDDGDEKESFKKAVGDKESTDEKDDKAEKAGEKVTKDIEYDDKEDEDEEEKVDEGFSEWADDGSNMASAIAQDGQDRESAETEKATAMAEGEEMCSECGGAMYEGEQHQCESHDHAHEKLDEWANGVNNDPELERFYATVKFMNDDITGGLNGKKVDQTTVPQTRVTATRGVTESSVADELRKLAGIR